MEQNEIRIIGILNKNTGNEVDEIQDVFTKFGCIIKTRLGLNKVFSKSGREYRMIIIEITGDLKEIQEFENKLSDIKDIEIQTMTFKD